MARIVDRIRAYLRSPQGQQLIGKGREQLSRPDNQRRLRQVMQRLRRRG
jgi:hypothetical protein